MAIIERVGTKILYCQFKYKGRRYLKSTGTSNLREAEAFERRFRTELEMGTETPALTPTVAVMRDLDVKRAREEGRTEVYIKNGIMIYFGHLIEFFKDGKVSEDSLIAYVAHRRSQAARRQTIAKELTCLKRGLRLARLPGPTYWPKLARDKPNEKQASKRHGAERIRAWLALLSEGARDVALFALLSGLRREELYRVRPEDIDGQVLTVREKVRRPESRRVWLCTTAMEIVPRLPFKADHKKAHQKAALATGATHITLRDCRAAFATAGDTAGDSRATDMAMGHSGIPARYQKSDLERLRRVAEAAETWLGYITKGTSVETDKS